MVLLDIQIIQKLVKFTGESDSPKTCLFHFITKSNETFIRLVGQKDLFNLIIVPKSLFHFHSFLVLEIKFFFFNDCNRRTNYTHILQMCVCVYTHTHKII